MRLAWWLAGAANPLLGTSVLVASISLIASVRGATVSWVVELVAIALSFWAAGAGLGAPADLAWPYGVLPSAGGSPDEEAR